MNGKILYLGDTSLNGAAAYLAGVMHQAGFDFDYLPSDVPCSEMFLGTAPSLVILSDYPCRALETRLQERLVKMVSEGTGLLMIGGWESFHGEGGDWDGSPVADILPVEIAANDDRVHCDHVALVRPVKDHPVLEGLPWEERPPVIGGYNRFVSHPDARQILDVHRLRPRPEGNTCTFTPEGIDPLLVMGRHGQGRTAALATDVAPHWVGPWVDWGPERVRTCAPGAEEVEVGNLYARFFRQLVSWMTGMGQEYPPPGDGGQE